jgi:flagellar hook-associated protein 2
MAGTTSIGSLTSSIDSLASQYKSLLQSQTLVPLQTKQASITSQVSAFATMKAKLQALYNAAGDMAGSQVARSDRVRSSRFSDVNNTIVNAELTSDEKTAGSATRQFTLSVGSNQSTINVTLGSSDTNNTVLTAIADAINNNVGANPYVTASVEVTGTGQSRLLLKSTGTGAASAITLQDANSGTMLKNIGITSDVIKNRVAGSTNVTVDDPVHAPGGYDYAGNSSILNASSACQYTSFSAQSSDSSVSVNASANASAGTHTIRVSSLAKADNLITKQYTAGATTVADGLTGEGFGTKKFTITNGTGSPVELSVAVASGDTDSQILSKVASAVNAAQGIGVSASVVIDDGTHLRLVFTSRSTGSATAITGIADTSGTLAGVLGLSGVNFSPAARTAASTSQAGFINTDSSVLDAAFTLDGIAIKRSTNSISDALSGVTINLQGISGTDVTVGVSMNNTQIQSNVQRFLDSYNAVLTYIKAQTAVDTTTYKRQIFAGNSTIMSLRSDLQMDMFREVPGLGDAPKLLSAVGITSDKQGMLSISDTTKFNAAITGDTTKLAQLFNSPDGVAVRLKNRLNAYVATDGRMDAGTTNLNSALKALTTRISSKSAQIDKQVLQYRDQFAQLQSVLATVTAQQTQLTQLYTALGLV